MSEEEQTVLIIRGSIASLPKDTQLLVKTIETNLRWMLDANPKEARMALALVGAELAAEGGE